MRRIVSILLVAAMLLTVRIEAPRAQGPVPLEIEQRSGSATITSGGQLTR